MDALTRAVAAVQLKKQFPGLVEIDPENYSSSLTTAAKNVRFELKKAFPGVKFQVKTSRYSGGDSLRASWIDGPSTKQVDAIIQKYSAGHFDGMTDYYEYGNDVFNEIFGGCKYVFAERGFSDELIAKVIEQVAKDYGGCEPFTVEDYRKGRAYYWKQSGGCDMQRAMSVAMSEETAFPEPEEMEVAA